MGLKQYVSSLIPEPYVILGVPLKPFSLGHYFLMVRYECGFVDEDKDRQSSIDDLLLAVCICSRTYDDFLTWIEDEKAFQSWLKNWGKVVRKQIKREEDFILVDKFMFFQEYMKQGTDIPKFWETDKSDSGSGNATHWTQSLMFILTSELNFTQTEALNMPLGQAFSHYCKYLEKNGVIEFMSEEEEELVCKT